MAKATTLSTLLLAQRELRQFYNDGESQALKELSTHIKELQSQPEKKAFYFLFGEDACRKYHEITAKKSFEDDLTFEEFLEELKKIGGFAIHKYIEGEHPENIMEAFVGWNDYAMITEEEYNLIEEIES
jgi:hypothetical protein